MYPIPFREFDEDGDIRVYEHGTLPHWRQDGCTYFVTFQQGDSLPLAVANVIKHERKLWLSRHGIDIDAPNWKLELCKLSKQDIREYERLVGKIVDEKLDQGLGSCALKQEAIAKILTDALQFFHGDRVLTGDFVIMPNHVHVLLRPLPANELEEVLHSIKSYTANRINRLLGKEGVFWQRNSYDHIVRDTEQLEAFQHYIRLNPVRANLSATDFTHRSATYVLED